MRRLDPFLRPLSLFVALGLTMLGLVSADGIWLLCMGGIMLCLLYLVWSTVPPLRAVRGAAGAGANEPLNDERVKRSVQMLAGFLLAGFMVLTLNLLRTQVVQAEMIQETQVVTRTTQVGDGEYEQVTQVIQGSRVLSYTETLYGDDVETGTWITQNPRILARELRTQRGNIYDAAGGLVAGREVFTDTGYVRRTYHAPEISYLLGYYNPTIYGLTGVEEEYDSYLSGETGTPSFIQRQNELLHRPVVGQDVYLTIDPELQRVATAVLGERKGAIVLLDAQSGAVKAMVSYPRYDPAGLSFNPNADDWGLENQRIVDYWSSITSGPAAADLPLLNRAARGLYPPGSTFKTITLAAGLDTGKVRPESVYTDTGAIQVEAGDYLHRDCATCRPPNHGDRFTLMEGYQWSLNVVFVELGVYQVQANALVRYAEQFGFHRAFDMAVPVETSRLGDAGFINTPNGLAATSYGQGQVEATPLLMALVAATVARGGEVPQPYIVDRVVNPQTGDVLVQTKPQNVNRAVSPDTAATLRQMMYTSVEKGWSQPAAVEGFAVGGKTGTAETGRGTTHAWFHAIAGKDANTPQWALAVIVEDGGEGSRVAAPMAGEVLAAALTR